MNAIITSHSRNLANSPQGSLAWQASTGSGGRPAAASSLPLTRHRQSVRHVPHSERSQSQFAVACPTAQRWRESAVPQATVVGRQTGSTSHHSLWGLGSGHSGHALADGPSGPTENSDTPHSTHSARTAPGTAAAGPATERERERHRIILEVCTYIKMTFCDRQPATGPLNKD